MLAQRGVALAWRGLAVALSLTACSNSSITKHPGTAGATQGEGGDSAQGGNTPITDTDIAAWPVPNDASLGLPNSASYDAASTPGVVHDLVTGLDWPQSPDTTQYTRADAVSYCEALSLGGIEDWRLPAFIELTSLFDVVPSQDATPKYIASVFQASGRYWSTSVPLSDNELGRLVDFNADSRCAALGPGARVPSITELLTILTPLLDATVFPGWPGNKFAWSSSTIPAISGAFWAGGITGASEASASTNMNRVQCVR